MKVAIMGTGVMGRGWIAQFAMNGHKVVCFDASEKSLEGAVPFCEKIAGKTAKRFKKELEQANAWLKEHGVE